MREARGRLLDGPVLSTTMPFLFCVSWLIDGLNLRTLRLVGSEVGWYLDFCVIFFWYLVILRGFVGCEEMARPLKGLDN